MQDNFGAEKKDWESLLDYIGPEDLLPIVSDTRVKPSPNSKVKEVGKVPSIITSHGYAAGLVGWTERISSKSDVDHWKTIPQYGIGIHCRSIKAIDVDVEDAMTVIDILSTYKSITGCFPNYRFRSNSARILIPFICHHPFGRIAIIQESEPDNKVEILSNGSQFVAYGSHKTGVKYEWTAADWPTNLVTLDEAMFEELVSRLQEYLKGPMTRAGERKARVLGESTFDPELIETDPIYNALCEQGSIINEPEEGIYNIVCPFDHEHSKGTPGDSSTQYFAPGTNGYAESRIICLHTHGNDMDAYANKLGIGEEYFNATRSVGLKVLPDEDHKKQLKSEANTVSLFHDDNIYGIINEETRTKWLIQGVLAQKSLNMMYGPPSAGKSFLIMDLAYSIASGGPFADRHRCDTKGKVLYVAAEGADGVRKRINVIRKVRNLGIGEDSENLVKIYTGSVNLMDSDEVNAFMRQVIDKMADSPPVCVVFDTLAANMIGDENNSRDGAAVISNCKRIIRKLGTSVVLVHHSGKNAELGARGWSGFKGAVDSELVVTVHENGVRSLRVSKNKDDLAGGEYAFKLDSVETGVEVTKYKRIHNADGSLGFLERDEHGSPIEVVAREYSMVVNWHGAELPVSKPERDNERHSVELATVINVMRDGRPDKSMKEIENLVRGQHPMARVKGLVDELIHRGRVKSNGKPLSDAMYSLVEDETGTVPDLVDGENAFDTS